MKIGITGGTGFLGTRLVERLSARGDELTVFTRSPEHAALPARAQAVGWNPVSEPAPSAALEGLDAVIHLLGEPVLGRWTEAKRARIRDSRVLGTRHLIEGWEASTQRPGVLVAGTAIGLYGDHGDAEITEDTPAGSGFLAEVGAAWETEILRAEGLGARVAMLRTPPVLHPDGGMLKAMLPPFKFGMGAIMGSGQQWMSWVHLEDWLALALRLLSDPTMRGPYNACAPEPVRNREFSKTLGRVLGVPVFLKAPAFALRLILGGLADEPLRSQRVLPQRAQDAGFRFQFAKLEDTLHDLLRPTAEIPR